MKATQHTPGPWTATIGTRGAHINIGNDHNHPLSFGFTFDEYNGSEQAEGQANARLIAKAWLLPELLEACERALPWIGKLIAEGVHQQAVMPGDAVRTMQMLEAAIAKATNTERT